MRISDTEKSLLKSTFKDRNDILLALRNLFFGFDLDERERGLITTMNTPAVRKLLRKMILPELEKDIPIGQSIDLWMTVQIHSLDEFQTQVSARMKLIRKVETALSMLETPGIGKVDLKFKDTIAHDDLISRNNFITHIEAQLLAIRTIVNQLDETPEQKAERQRKDSAK